MTSEARVDPTSTGRPQRFEFAPHHCFACGTLNAHGLGLVAPRRAGRSLDRAHARPPLPGLGRHRPRRDPVHDPRRGHGLGPGRRGQLGRHGPHDRRLPQAGRRRPRRSAPKGGSPARAAGSSTPPGRIVDADDRRDPRDRRPASTSPPSETRKRGAPRTLRLPAQSPVPAELDATDAVIAGGRRRDASDRDRPGHARPRQPGDRPRRRVRRRAQGRGRGARRPASPTTSTTRTRSPPRCARPSARSPTRSTSRASSGSPRASAPSHGVRWPLIAAVVRGFRRRHPPRRPDPAPVRRRPPLPRARARGALVRLRPPRAHPRRRDRSGPGSCSGAPPARPATGSRSTPSPIRTARASPPSRIAGRSSSSSSTPRRAGSAASSAPRSRR